MYRILIADDEGLMLEAFKGVILAEFGDKCSVETAKTGRAVIEKAETFHPDIVFMDIHMPGINGIQAMREIRKFNNSALFYVVSAYDKFDYAKEAINLGVEQYLTKPISKSKIISVVEEATAKVDKVRDQRSNLLKIQEKLETVIPVVESGYVNSLLFQKEMAAADYYQQLLDIEYSQGYVMVVQFGQSYENGRLVSPVGMNVKAQSFYPEFRDVVKSAFPCVVGNIMSNRIPVVVPCEIFQNPYEDRIDLVEKARELVARLEGRLDAKFRVGIGRVWEMEELERSYREALRALNGSLSRVIHIEDLSQNGVYDEAFPGNDEKRMFRCLEEGNEEGMLQEVNFFCDWMVEHYSQDMNNIRLKILEFIIWGEKIAFERSLYEDFPNATLRGRASLLYKGIDEGTISRADAMAELENMRQINTDWFDEIFRVALNHKHVVTLSGGSETTQFYSSINYSNEQGVIPNNDYKHFGATLKLTHDFNRNLRILFDVSSSLRTEKSSASAVNPLYYATFANPYERPYDENGNYAYDYSYEP